MVQTLRTSKAHEGIFQWTILGFATGNCIQNLIFDGFNKIETCAFVHNTFPHLPNLRSIKGLIGSVSRTFELVHEPLDWHRTDIVNIVAERRAGEALLRIADQITNWEIEKDEKEAELLLSRNYDAITALALSSDVCWGFPIFDSEASKFPALLCNCPQLRSLSITNTSDVYGGGVNVKPLVDPILTLPFPFAQSLRSLTLDLEGFATRTTHNEFAFVALFPSLESLKFTFSSDNLDEIKSKSYLLPKLTSLEIINCPFMHMHDLFRSLLLPSISTISLSHSDVPRNRPVPNRRTNEIRLLVLELKAYFSTLQTLHLHFLINLPKKAVEYLLPLADDIAISVIPKPMPPKRKRFPSSGNYDEEDIESEISDNESLPRSYPENMVGATGGQHGEDIGFESTKELVDWAQERVYSCGTVDDVGLQEMRRMLEPIRDLKEWIAD